MTSNTTSLPEVAGDAALLVDPLDVSGISAALRQLHDDVALREALAERGLLRARGFSWDVVTERVCTVLGSGKTA